jgi:hypothetical protein
MVLVFLRVWVDPRTIVRQEGIGQLKSPMTSTRFKPTTFQLVAKCLNQLGYRAPDCNSTFSNLELCFLVTARDEAARIHSVSWRLTISQFGLMDPDPLKETSWISEILSIWSHNAYRIKGLRLFPGCQSFPFAVITLTCRFDQISPIHNSKQTSPALSKASR